MGLDQAETPELRPVVVRRVVVVDADAPVAERALAEEPEGVALQDAWPPRP